MHVVSLIVGLAVAVSSAIAMGGWQTDASVSTSAQAASFAAPLQASSTTTIKPPSTANAPRLLLVLTDTRDGINEVHQRLSASFPDWEISIITMDNQIASADFPGMIDALTQSVRLGGIKDLQVIDERKP